METVITVAIWTLAFYGLIELLKNIMNLFWCTKLHSNGIYFIVATKNQEEHIEGFLRSLMFKIISGREERIKNVIVVDLNSKDHTKEIIERLEQEYDVIQSLSCKECKELMKSIEEA